MAAAAAAAPEAAALVTRDNEHHKRDIELHYRAAMRGARERVVIANAYFFPGYRLLQGDAARRASRRVGGSDPAGRARHGDRALCGRRCCTRTCIRAGVRMHEYCQRPLHGKVAVVDDEWSTVGSSNLDPLSLALNLEANVIVRDRSFALQLRAHLDQLIEHSCKEVMLPPPTPLSSALAQVRGFFVFHFLHRFPAWVAWLPNEAPRVEALRAEVSAATALDTVTRSPATRALDDNCLLARTTTRDLRAAQGSRRVALDATGEQQHDEHQHDEAEPAAGPVAPAGAVRPGGQGAHQHQDQDDQQDQAEAHGCLLGRRPTGAALRIGFGKGRAG